METTVCVTSQPVKESIRKELPPARVVIKGNVIRFYGPDDKYSYNNLQNFVQWISKVLIYRKEHPDQVKHEFCIGSGLEA